MYLTWLIVLEAVFLCSTGLASASAMVEEKQTRLGFDLSSSHGTVAVAFNNGTSFSITRIEGDALYKQTMKEMSEWKTEWPWTGHPRQRALFVDMLKTLRREAERFLGYQIESALVAMPDLRGYRKDEMTYAIEEIGLTQLDRVPDETGVFFRQPPALYAFNGFGICKNYHDRLDCDKKELAMPREWILTILFTSNALCVEVSILQSAYALDTSDTFPTSMDFSLGYQERHNNPDEKFFWAAVTERIMRSSFHNALDRLAMVLINGDTTAIADPQFEAAVDEALSHIRDRSIPIYKEDPENAAALGAAELAKRGWWPYPGLSPQPPPKSTTPGLMVQE